MRRRAFLAGLSGRLGAVALGASAAAAITAGSAATAGCLGLDGDTGFDPPPRLEDPPRGVYVPPAVSGLRLVGVADAGDVRLALMYGYPARFWEVVGEQTYRRDIEPADDVHLSALAWDPDTGVVLPEVGLTVEVTQDGSLVAEEAVYAMISQRMGFHYGDNFALDGDGRYDVTVSIGGLHVRRTGSFADRFGDPASHTFAFEYAQAERDRIAVETPANPGTSGAVDATPPDSVPAAVAPGADGSDRSPPGAKLGSATDAGVVFDAYRLEDATEEPDPVVAVVAHTPWNDLLLPSMGLRLRLEGTDDGSASGDGESPAEGILDRTVDPDLGYHHRLAVPAERLEAASALVIETVTPPQVARHEGYETAFLDVDPVTIPL